MEILAQLGVLFAVMFAGFGVGWIARDYTDRSSRRAIKEIAYAQGATDGYLDSLRIITEESSRNNDDQRRT
jgi:hypothetical protein